MRKGRDKRVEVIRPFYKGGEIQGVGSVIDLPGGYADELVGAGKCQYTRDNAKLKVTDKVPEPKDGKLPADDGGDGKE